MSVLTPHPSQQNDARVVLLMGPTASGKTGLSLALARRFAAQGRRAEIICVDSAQVYRGMDIGTAKPDANMRSEFAHHLLDILDPSEAYSAARFREDALRLIQQIRVRGNLPLLVGGTMLYFRALTRGLAQLPSASAELRAQLSDEAARLGWPALHARLAKCDPETAARLHPQDRQRIQRALEVIALSGRPLSQLHAVPPRDAEGAFVKIALNPPQREELHRRIEIRFHDMMAHGFLDEVTRLHARGDLHPDLPAMRAVGYRQLLKYLDGACTLAEAQASAIAATRQFAKRQLTWLRSEHDLCWINPDAPDATEQAWNLALGKAPVIAC